MSEQCINSNKKHLLWTVGFQEASRRSDISEDCRVAIAARRCRSLARMDHGHLILITISSSEAGCADGAGVWLLTTIQLVGTRRMKLLLGLQLFTDLAN